MWIKYLLEIVNLVIWEMQRLNAIIRADGSPGFSMASTLIGAITNIILDPLFIFGFKWGIAELHGRQLLGNVYRL